MKKTKTIGIKFATVFAAMGIGITAIPAANAGALHLNGNGGGAVVQTGPHLRYYAPLTTTVKHNNHKEAVKVCREYYYGTKTCAKWTY